jgi:hypothetical protein
MSGFGWWWTVYYFYSSKSWVPQLADNYCEFWRIDLVSNYGLRNDYDTIIGIMCKKMLILIGTWLRLTTSI